MTYDLTPNETRALIALTKAALASCNSDPHAHPSYFETEEFTWVEANDLRIAGWSKEGAAGTFGALMTKGIIGGENLPTNHRDYRCETYLETGAWKYAITIWDEEEIA